MKDPPEDITDVQQWKSFLNGDQEALSAIFEKYYRPLLNYGLKLVSQEDLVKDSIQELFILMWNRRGHLSDVEYVRSYLYSSLRRTVFRLAEIQRARHRRDRSYSKENFNEVLNQEELMISKEMNLEQREMLNEALDDLSSSQKEVVFLKFYSGLSNSEIAEVMGINRQSVYNSMYRAIESLSDFLSASEVKFP